VFGALQDRLDDVRCPLGCGGAEDLGVGGHLAVLEHGDPHEREGLFERCEGLPAFRLVGGHKEGRHRDRAGFVAEHRERNLGHHARTVAAQPIEPGGTAVLHGAQGSQRALEVFVGSLPLQGGDEADSACAVLGARHRDSRW